MANGKGSAPATPQSGTANQVRAQMGQIDMYRFDTPLGQMLACATPEGICLCEFADRPALETELKDLRRLLKSTTTYANNPHFGKLEKQLNEYFAGTRKEFDLELVAPGTKFQVQVWKTLQEIPYGETRTYSQQAIALGMPDAVRAIAAANGQNRIAIVIPCHRVIGSDGSMTGYGGGVWRKKKLLEIEGFKKRQPELFPA